MLVPISQVKLARLPCAFVLLMFIGGYFGFTPESAGAAEGIQPFAAFKTDVDIDIEDGELEFVGVFTLSPDSDGIDPIRDLITLQLRGGTGTYAVTIPAGSFKKERNAFTFQGTIDRVRLRASVRLLRDRAFEFQLENERANFKGFANPVTVSLTIGDDGASQTLKAKIE